MASRRRKLAWGSPAPWRAATVISRVSLVNNCPRLLSVISFLCLMVAHLECPDILAHPPLCRLGTATSRGRPAPPNTPGRHYERVKPRSREQLTESGETVQPDS